MSGWSALGTVAGGVLGSALNFGSQYMTNQLNKKLTKEQWKRDDTAVQRRVDDLRAAGLSPVLAAGSAAGNSAAIPAKAPEFNLDPMILLQAKQAEADISMTRAQEQLTKVQAREHSANAALKEKEYEFADKTFDDRVSTIVTELAGKRLHNNLQHIEQRLREEFGRSMALAEREIARNKALLSGYDLSEKEMDLVAKQMTLEDRLHDREWFSSRDLPIQRAPGIGDSQLLKRDLSVASADIYDKVGRKITSVRNSLAGARARLADRFSKKGTKY